MGTIKREKRGRREFDTLHREHLYDGWEGIDGCGYGAGDRLDLAAMEADWFAHDAELMAEWEAAWGERLLGVKRHGFGEPSCRSLRPWAYWVFVAKVDPPDLGEELDILRDRGLAQEGDVERHRFLLDERELQRQESEKFERHRLGHRP